MVLRFRSPPLAVAISRAEAQALVDCPSLQTLDLSQNLLTMDCGERLQLTLGYSASRIFGLKSFLIDTLVHKKVKHML